MGELEHSDGKFIVRRIDGASYFPDEPVFVFRAHDTLLPDVLTAYRSMCSIIGSPRSRLDAIDRRRERIEAWQAEHGTKVPD